MFPLFSPITMVVRIRIADPACLADYSLAVTGGRNRLVFDLAGNLGSTGSVMLMYGKKATIPEVLRWIRQD